MSKIEWTDRTWNPNQGCTKKSTGCINCYAEPMHKRLKAMGIDKYQKDFNVVQLWLAALTEPTKWKKPSMVFVNSMSDTFHRNLTFKQIDQVFNTMDHCKRHTFQVLTKRPDRALEYITWKRKQLSDQLGIQSKWKPAANIWFGATIENQENANERIPLLLQIPAAKHFVSIEPMLGSVNLEHIDKFNENGNVESRINAFSFLDWVICGGETGPNARPMHIEHVYELLEDCRDYKMPFFFKSWGEWQGTSCGKGYLMQRVGKKKAGCKINGVEFKEFPV
jgi:protein gp37